MSRSRKSRIVRVALFVPLAAVAAHLVSATALRAQSDDFGAWVELFNGKDTSGWENAKPKEQAGPNRWTVEDGALTNEKAGVNDVCTQAEFDNYELELWYRVPPKGNSGVYLRGQVEVQILDNESVPDAKLGGHHAGAIYGGHKPLRNPQGPAETWNLYRIRHLGNRITVWHNGILVQDDVHVPKATPGSMAEHGGKPLSIERGPLMFQGDHGKVWFRAIRVRPLCSPAAGWKPLWNGKDLSEFRSHGERKAEDFWSVDSKANAFHNQGRSGSKGSDLWTREAFGNFLVHYEYRSSPKVEGGNSGFYLRDQWEIQIYGAQSQTDPHQDASLYSRKVPSIAARHSGAEQWNHMDVKVAGMKIWVWQNGQLVHDGVTLDTRTDNHGVKTEKFSKAPFKLQGDHGEVWFTNLYIKPLAERL